MGDNGYGYIRDSPPEKTLWLAHRLAFKLEFGWLPDVVCHRCDNPKCVRPDHLFGGSHGDNIADKVAKGRAPTGVSHWNCKLTPSDVVEVRRLVEGGARQADVAHQFGVHQSHVSRVCARKSRPR